MTLPKSPFVGSLFDLSGTTAPVTGSSRGIGRAIAIHSITALSPPAEDKVARGKLPGWFSSQEWFNEVGYPAAPADAHKLGLHPMDFATWARANAAAIPRH